MTEILEKARQREREYHEQYYREHQLGDSNTWLARPARYALDAMSFVKTAKPNILDLGCGVGRHALPILSKTNIDAKVVGIDIVPEAIDILRVNADQSGVSNRLSYEITDISAYECGVDRFDLVLSVSCIEHVPSLNELQEMLRKIQLSTRRGGVNCFMISSDINWYDEKNDEHIVPIIEFPLKSTELIPLLEQTYDSWSILDLSSKCWSVPDIINDREFVNKSLCVQFTAIRPEEV